MPPASRDEVGVLVVGEDPLARSALAQLLGDRPGIAILGHQSAGEDVAAAVAALEADAVLWDLGPRARSAPAELREMAEEGAAAVIVALASDERAGADALAAGARGLLPRDAAGEHIAAALQAVARGLLVLDDAFATLLSARTATTEGALESLTPRELEVLALLSEGLPNKTIAQRLGISDHTAKFHVNAILGKLGVQSRTEAVVRAARLGLVVL